MNFREIIDLITLNEKTETYPFTTYTGIEIDLKLIWNPSPNEAMGAVRRSEDQILRVLLVDQDIACWDAYYVEHRDVAKLLDRPELMRGRDNKLYIVWDAEKQFFEFQGGSWNVNREHYQSIPAIARLLNAGFQEPS